MEISDINLIPVGVKSGENGDFEVLIFPMDADEFAAYETACGTVAYAVLDSLGKTSHTASDLADADDVRDAVNSRNSIAADQIDCTLNPGETKTFFIVAWAEHDDIYLEDALSTNDLVSHSSLEMLEKGKEAFKIQFLSKQAD